VSPTVLTAANAASVTASGPGFEAPGPHDFEYPPLFDVEERISFLEEAIEEKGLDNVTVDKFDVLVVEFAKNVGANVIVKGLRAISDYLYETEMAQLNRNEEPEVESFYLIASPEYSFLSSSGIKDMATFGGNITPYVPDRVARRLQEELTRQRTTG